MFSELLSFMWQNFINVGGATTLLSMVFFLHLWKIRPLINKILKNVSNKKDDLFSENCVQLLIEIVLESYRQYIDKLDEPDNKADLIKPLFKALKFGGISDNKSADEILRKLIINDADKFIRNLNDNGIAWTKKIDQIITKLTKNNYTAYSSRIERLGYIENLHFWSTLFLAIIGFIITVLQSINNIYISYVSYCFIFIFIGWFIFSIFFIKEFRDLDEIDSR